MNVTTSRPQYIEPVFSARAHLIKIREDFEAYLRDDILEEDDDLAQSFKAVHQEITRSIDALSTPSIQIATVGTTSAGKSTFINALLGLQLAPTDADEMSAGLLTIGYEPSRWSILRGPGELPSERVTAQDIHNYLHAQMAKRIASRRQGKEDPGASFEIAGPLYPLAKNHDFRHALGDDVSMKLFDLPGLRTVDDPANMRVIKQQIKRAFSVVVLNMTHFFSREKRAALVGELKDTVRDLGNDTSTIIFVANQADRFTSNDIKNKSLEARVEEAREELRTLLELDESDSIHMVPMSALNYFRALRALRARPNGRV